MRTGQNLRHISVGVLLFLLTVNDVAANDIGHEIVRIANDQFTEHSCGKTTIKTSCPSNASEESNSDSRVDVDPQLAQSAQPFVPNISRGIWVIPQRNHDSPYIVSTPCSNQMNILCCPLESLCPPGLPPCPQPSPQPPCCPLEGTCPLGLSPCPSQFPRPQCCPLYGSCRPGLPPCSRR